MNISSSSSLNFGSVATLFTDGSNNLQINNNNTNTNTLLKADGFIFQNTSNQHELTIDNTGNTVFQNSVNSTTAFQIQNAASSSIQNTLFTADTVNNKINVSGNLNVGTAYGNRLFSDGFESGNMALWGGASTGSATANTTQVHNGKYAARVVTSGSASYDSTFFPSNTTVYAREWVYVSSRSTASNLLSLFDTTGTEYQIAVSSTGVLGIWYSVGNSTLGTGGSLPTGSWHEVQLRITAVGAGSTAQLWLDGTLVVNIPSTSLGSNPINRLMVGDDDAGDTATTYHDDMSVDTVSQPSYRTQLMSTKACMSAAHQPLAAPCLSRAPITTPSRFRTLVAPRYLTLILRTVRWR